MVAKETHWPSERKKKRQKHEFLPHLKESQRYIQDYSSQFVSTN